MAAKTRKDPAPEIAEERSPALDILRAQDILAEAYQLVEAIWMAPTDLERVQRGPIHAVADVAGAKIQEAMDLLQETKVRLKEPA